MTKKEVNRKIDDVLDMLTHEEISKQDARNHISVLMEKFALHQCRSYGEKIIEHLVLQEGIKGNTNLKETITFGVRRTDYPEAID